MDTRIQVDHGRAAAPLEFNCSSGAEDAMRMLIVIYLLVGSASAQQLFTRQNDSLPREAESILIASCRIVGERLAIPLPDPKVELRLGEKINTVDSRDGIHIIRLQRWDKVLFKMAALHVCMRAVETDIVGSMVKQVRDY
jgi:hypothetical protein